MKVGDTVTVYHEVRKDPERCDHGDTHMVPIYEVKRLTIVEIRREMITALNYDSDGMGDVLYAKDTQGRIYRKQPHWDGPRATVWLRIAPGKLKTFDQYPRVTFSRDITGRRLRQLESTRISVVH
jgi:hypothetical protein